MKIVYAGSPEYAVPALKMLWDGGKEIVAVVTQPDKPVGRKRVLTPTPVKAFAASLGIPVFDFKKIREHVSELCGLHADMMITCAYGQLLTQEVLDCFPAGVWNLHASLLPKYRGASPIQSAILAGETHTGVTVMKTELDLDTGDILLVKRCKIGDSTYGELSERLSLLSAEAAWEAAELIEKGQTQLLLQNEGDATYCKKIQKSDAKVDFARSAAQILQQIKAFSPQPAAYCMQNGVSLNLLDAALGDATAGGGSVGEVLCADKNGICVKCGEGAVNITQLQPAGGKIMRAADYVNGRKIKAGDLLE